MTGSRTPISNTLIPIAASACAIAADTMRLAAQDVFVLAENIKDSQREAAVQFDLTYDELRREYEEQIGTYTVVGLMENADNRWQRWQDFYKADCVTQAIGFAFSFHRSNGHEFMCAGAYAGQVLALDVGRYEEDEH